MKRYTVTGVSVRCASSARAPACPPRGSSRDRRGDAVRAREIQSETSHAGGEEEEEDIPAGVEEVDESLALGEGSGAVHAAVAEGLDERGERGKPEWRGRAR